ncbi:MAG: MBL fold metallo-hydrolase [Bacteroidetes bacterium]|nr:MAG: MBL fold metallo-hydrolase [Bacteroidota bacterium]
MRVCFWGVRGSIPTPGADTSRYGGNTACITIELSPGATLVLDAGTGIRSFGDSVPARDHTYYILLSHLHWDHIQGFPMFKPLASDRTRIQFISHESVAWGEATASQIDGVHFPVSLSKVPAKIVFDRVGDDSLTRELTPFFDSVSVFASDHPGGSFGYRFELGDVSIVYMTDNELPTSDTLASDDSVVQFCSSATYLIHDAQFLESEMERKKGWGHSDVSSVCRLATLANVDNLILFHHNPSRTDRELDGIQVLAEGLLRANGSSCSCRAASEGDTFEI